MKFPVLAHAAAVCFVALSAPLALAQVAATPEAKAWHALSDKKDLAGAEKLCSGWEKSGTHAQQVEAEKCLANVELARGRQASVKGSGVDAASVGPGFSPQAIDKALAHLNRGLALAPADISLHKGRLFVLGLSGRDAALTAALDDTLTKLPSPDYLPDWLRYTAQIGASGDAKEALKLLAVLDKHFPDSHEVIGNIGTMYNIQGLWSQGLPYTKRAAELAPKDTIDTWNLGWAYMHLGEIKLADEWMQKSIALPGDDQGSERRCLYAHFVGRDLKQKPRACAMERRSCAVPDRYDCSAPTIPHKK
ncbi:MAG: hypothetical protein PW792_14800 [Acidobacteriaceae bacterium]|nr:hypothetical protein [Acidobacteriaceae bacterium]